MYCERCGKRIEEALNFCNACGAQLKKEDEPQKGILNTLITAVIVIGTGGLGVLVGLLAVLLDKVPRIEPVIAFAIFYLATVFGICFMLMRQISKLIDAKLDKKETRETPAIQPLVQLPAMNTAQLEEYRQPASVVENTTRTLDEVPLRRG